MVLRENTVFNSLLKRCLGVSWHWETKKHYCQASNRNQSRRKIPRHPLPLFFSNNILSRSPTLSQQFQINFRQTITHKMELPLPTNEAPIHRLVNDILDYIFLLNATWSPDCSMSANLQLFGYWSCHAVPMISKTKWYMVPGLSPIDPRSKSGSETRTEPVKNKVPAIARNEETKRNISCNESWHQVLSVGTLL